MRSARPIRYAVRWLSGRLTGGGGATRLEDTQQLLDRWKDGDDSALSELTQRVYGELRARAASLLGMPAGGALALQPTELVNECYLKLLGRQSVANLQDRSHFMALAARAMRHILTDHYRYLTAGKRDGHEVTLGTHHLGDEQNVDLFELERALEQLEQIDPELSELVEMKYFAGMSVPELAQATGRSESTVKRQWRAARAWLGGALGVVDGD